MNIKKFFYALWIFSLICFVYIQPAFADITKTIPTDLSITTKPTSTTINTDKDITGLDTLEESTSLEKDTSELESIERDTTSTIPEKELDASLDTTSTTSTIPDKSDTLSDSDAVILDIAEICDGIDNDRDGEIDEGVKNACGSCGPVPRENCDGLDNNCNGVVDDNLPEKPCYDGPYGTLGVGICRGGAQTCTDGKWEKCTGQILPQTEICNGLDDDCDGEIDEDNVCNNQCTPGDEEACGLSTGLCESGKKVCLADGSWSACLGGVKPLQEICNGLDDDCDGEIDEDIADIEFYPGPTTTKDVGICESGVKSCLNGAWTTTTAPILPFNEVCDGVDNNCDGTVDEDCECINGDTRDCGVSIGQCKQGTQTCVNGNWNKCDDAIFPQNEVCDGLDNNCDNIIDENISQECYTGPQGTQNVGVCHGGVQICKLGDFGKCEGQVLPQQEICDGLDNNCDGIVDEGCDCVDGETRSIGTDIGSCKTYGQKCERGEWVTIEDGQSPSAETCDGVDNNCNGQIDENISEACYTGPQGTAGQGECRTGVKTCGIGGFGICQGQILPSAEICDGLDNNCDGVVDEGCGCQNGAVQACGSSEGVCTKGTQTCRDNVWSKCENATDPTAEICDGLDNNCDGVIDEGCDCQDGETRSCGSDQGVCTKGSQSCQQGKWGICTGGIIPINEVCDGLDNDCDGQIDEDLTQPLYNGTPGTEGVGVCQAGTQSCSDGNWVDDQNQVLAEEESCDGLDNNCDGVVDENCECEDGETRACGTNTGTCERGVQSCVDGAWSATCVGSIEPQTESCNGKDDNCNGLRDEGYKIGKACFVGVGACRQIGSLLCNVDGESSVCNARPLQPTEEICGDNKDNDCDGETDEGCLGEVIPRNTEAETAGTDEETNSQDNAPENEDAVNFGTGDIVTGGLQMGGGSCSLNTEERIVKNGSLYLVLFLLMTVALQRTLLQQDKKQSVKMTRKKLRK